MDDDSIFNPFLMKPIETMEGYDSLVTLNVHDSKVIQIFCETFKLANVKRKNPPVARRFKEYRCTNMKIDGNSDTIEGRLPDGIVGWQFPIGLDAKSYKGVSFEVCKKEKGKARVLFTELPGVVDNPTGLEFDNVLFAKEEADMAKEDWARISAEIHAAVPAHERFGSWEMYENGRFFGGYPHGTLRFPACVRGHSFWFQFSEYVMTTPREVMMANGQKTRFEKDTQWTQICLMPVSEADPNKNQQNILLERATFVTNVLMSMDDAQVALTDILANNLIQYKWLKHPI